MIPLLLVLVGVALVAVVLGVASGRIRVDPLSPATHSVPDHGLPAVPESTDVGTVRFDTAPTGYRPREVDAHLDELRDRLAEQERRIAALRQDARD